MRVDRSIVSRMVQLFRTTGSASKKPYPKQKAFRKLITPAQLLILHLVIQKPGIYLCKIQEELLHVLLLKVDVVVTICRFLNQSGFIR